MGFSSYKYSPTILDFSRGPCAEAADHYSFSIIHFSLLSPPQSLFPSTSPLISRLGLSFFHGDAGTLRSSYCALPIKTHNQRPLSPLPRSLRSFPPPSSFSLSVYPTINQLIRYSSTQNFQTYLSIDGRFGQERAAIPINSLIFLVIYTLFVSVISLLAVGSVTSSVFHGFYGRPVKLVSAIKSSFASLFPLLATSFVQGIILFGIFLVYGVLLFSLIKAIELLDFEIDVHSPYLLASGWVIAIVLIVVVIYMQVNWSLVNIVVAVESSWGFQPLRRSGNLIKGMRRIALWLVLVVGFLTGILGWESWMSALGLDDAVEKWKSWGFVLSIVGTTAFHMLIMLYNLAATTVLYMYAKAIHGELAGEIAEEFAREYVSLPFDQGKVPHLVSIAAAAY